jgi:HrpA-like helicases
VGEKLGESISFKVRFNEQGSQDSIVRLMTDGILLAELANDRFLNKYDTIIIDEAHERSLNIDFIWAISNSSCLVVKISKSLLLPRH